MQRKGFTLIEIMIVVGILALIGTVVSLNLYGSRTRTDLTDTTKDMATLLREAQSDSLSEKQGSFWGVHFDNTSSTEPYYSLYYGSSTSIGIGGTGNFIVDVTVGQYNLPGDICYAPSSLPVGSSTNIAFNQVSGAPFATATIALELMSGGGCPVPASTTPSTVTRVASGKIFFDPFNRSSL